MLHNCTLPWLDILIVGGCAVQVRRVQMRFPSRIPTADRKPGKYPLGPPHDFTILDGECAGLACLSKVKLFPPALHPVVLAQMTAACPVACNAAYHKLQQSCRTVHNAPL